MIPALLHPARRAICTIAVTVVLGLLWSLAGYCSHLHRAANGPANAQDAPCSLCMHMERFAGPPSAASAIVPVIAGIILPRIADALPAIPRSQFRSYFSRAPPAR